MINLIIKRLSIRNFKTFDRVDLVIDSDHLIVLDGPNGFGKTSFFDALELFFTGNIRRYLELERLIVDRRSRKIGCPWLYKQADEEAFLSIRVELLINQNSYFLERVESKENLDRITSLMDLKIPLYRLQSLESVEKVKLEDDDFFYTLLGKEYKRDLELYHYVEQEDNIRFLKVKEKDRQGSIAHLFDIEDIQNKIAKITEINKSISLLCNKQEEKKVTDLRKAWEESKNKLLGTKEVVDYKKLIEITNQPWDKEILDFDIQQFDEWLSPNGILTSLQLFIQNFFMYEKKLYNKNLENKIIKPEETIKKLLQFGHRLDFKKEWEKDIERFTEAQKLKENFLNINKSLISNELISSKVLSSFLPEKITFIEFVDKAHLLKSTIEMASKLDKSIVNLLNVRDEMLTAFSQYNQCIDPTGECPTCGYDWEDASILAKELDNEKKVLKQLLEEKNEIFSEEIEYFKEQYQKPVEALLDRYLLEEREKIDYKKSLINLTEIEVITLINYAQELKNAEVDYSDLQLQEYNLNTEVSIDLFLKRINSIFKEIDNSKLSPNFDFIYNNIFQRNMSLVKVLDLNDVNNKILYITQQMSLAQSKYIATCKRAYDEANSIYKKSQAYRKTLNQLKKIYEEEKEKYLESIIREIEILFHIYSGRLMQNSKQGLGLFIENKGSLIAFHEEPGQEYDAVFSMSSGQLSALVLAFTLSLNKRYANHNLLFIDDPVQTLDEINIAGFIELLRTEFNQYQIFLSTHEDHVSAYFRYKYLKYKIPVDRINFMEIGQINR